MTNDFPKQDLTLNRKVLKQDLTLIKRAAGKKHAAGEAGADPGKRQGRVAAPSQQGPFSLPTDHFVQMNYGGTPNDCPSMALISGLVPQSAELPSHTLSDHRVEINHHLLATISSRAQPNVICCRKALQRCRRFGSKRTIDRPSAVFLASAFQAWP